MESVRGLLQHRTAVAVVLFIFLVVSVQSWLGIMKPVVSPRHNPVELFGLVFSIVLTGAIAYGSSRLVWDRVVFGSANAALILAAVTAIFSVAPPTGLVIQAAKSLLWTVAAVASLVCLIRGLSTPRSTVSH